MKCAIKAGDIVFHRPTGETWVVAAVEGNSFFAAGWPETRASISHVELKESCSDADHVAMLVRAAEAGGSRGSAAWQNLRDIRETAFKETTSIDKIDDSGEWTKAERYCDICFVLSGTCIELAQAKQSSENWRFKYLSMVKNTLDFLKQQPQTSDVYKARCALEKELSFHGG